MRLKIIGLETSSKSFKLDTIVKVNLINDNNYFGIVTGVMRKSLDVKIGKSEVNINKVLVKNVNLLLIDLNEKFDHEHNLMLTCFDLVQSKILYGAEIKEYSDNNLKSIFAIYPKTDNYPMIRPSVVDGWLGMQEEYIYPEDIAKCLSPEFVLPEFLSDEDND